MGVKNENAGKEGKIILHQTKDQEVSSDPTDDRLRHLLLQVLTILNSWPF
jgi:protein involved in temperature-dependent protein secretion